jgi:hypothetical protein
MRAAIFPTVAALAAASVVVVTAPARGQLSLDASEFTGSGGWVSNATCRLACAAGQPAGRVSVGADLVLYAGFLGGAMIRPGLLSRSGIPLEADPDNDADRLADWDELTGAAFGGLACTDPNDPDSDGDGMSDGDEALVMFDPNDPTHVLRITLLTCVSTVRTLRWTGKGGGAHNIVQWSADLANEPFTNVHSDVVYPGGTPPWYKVLAATSWNDPISSNRFYRVRIVK